MRRCSSAKRAADIKSAAEKSAAQADAEALVVKKGESLTSTQMELMAIHEYKKGKKHVVAFHDDILC